jgi:CheY-like chemotaxis protein
VWIGSDGSRLRALGLAEIDPDDLTVLSRTATSLGYELALRPEGGLARALVAAAESAAELPDGAPSAVELVESLARVLGLLDLMATDDTALLVRRLRAANGDAALELSTDEEDAHRRTLERMTGMWGSIPA